MSKAEDRGKTYALHKAREKLHDYYGNAMLSVIQFDGYDIKNAYIDGYHQAEKDLELTWKDIVMIDKLLIGVGITFPCKSTPDYYQEVLERFKDLKERKEK